MCLFGGKRKSGSFTPGVKPIQDTDTSLPEAKKVTPDDKEKDVKYGGKGARSESAQQSQGAKSLMINLPSSEGASTGGVNTGQ